MGDFSLNSPRRRLSLSKERTTRSASDSDERVSGFAVSEEHGAKPSEVYGFVGSISTVVMTAIFLLWAYIPEPWLHFLGITYYPSKYWALAVPAYGIVAVVSILIFYIGLNFMMTPPPTSLNTIFDDHTRECLTPTVSVPGIEQPIEPISDIPINQINTLMFG